MLYYNFKDYEGFKELFGLRECGNGTKTRRNKILLSYIKQHKLLKGAIAGKMVDRYKINIKTMDQLLRQVKDDLFWKGGKIGDGRHKIDLLKNKWEMFSKKMRLDERNGICDDGDSHCVRYINCENGRVYKMKAGKFLNTIILESEWGQELPEPVRLWMCEQFAQEWEVYATAVLHEDEELHVDQEFWKIYDEDECDGDFHSCMTGEDYYSFYEDYVDAKAAYLTDGNGLVIARCVIFTRCHLMDGSGRVLRLAERQYSTGCDDVLKRRLVDALIKADEIDGYKRVGADCHSGHAFVLNDGSPLSCDMWIACSADDGDTCSYMDSFKYLNTSESRAYNDDSYEHDAELDTTDGYVEVEDRHFDSYHDEYTGNDVVTVYYHGREYTCDEYRLDDFVNVDGEYYHTDDVCYCDHCEGYYLSGEGYESELTGEVYCCQDCLEEAEREWKEENWMYSEYDDEYYEDVEVYINEDGDEETISEESLTYLRNHGKVWYDEDNEKWNATVRETENEEA